MGVVRPWNQSADPRTGDGSRGSDVDVARGRGDGARGAVQAVGPGGRGESEALTPTGRCYEAQLQEGEQAAGPQLHSVPQVQSGLHAQAALTGVASTALLREEQPQVEVSSFSEVMMFSRGWR